MKINKGILIGIILIITLLLISIGVSYSYFTANLEGGEDSTTITVIGGTMNVVYNGGPNINIANIIPSNNPIATKIFTVTGNNTTDLAMEYQISLVVESNTFSTSALKYHLISTNTSNNGTVAPSTSIENLINIGTGAKNINLGVGSFASPTEGNKVHTYQLNIYFPNQEYNQNIDQEKELQAYILIENKKVIGLDGYTLATDDDFIKVSIPEMQFESIWLYIGNDDYVIIPDIIKGEVVTSTKGMFVSIPDFEDSGYPVKGVASFNPNLTDTSFMFIGSLSNTLDLSSFDTSNVTNMSFMFLGSQATDLDLNTWNTAKVTDMSFMFQQVVATTIDLSSWDTSSVTDMNHMFYDCRTTILDLSSFNTSKVTDMSQMFENSWATTIDVSSFDTTNVTNMRLMFGSTNTSALDVSSFNTSNVTDMSGMFEFNKNSILDLSSFDTSKVTDMNSMFRYSWATTIVVSSFDTTNVTNMSLMFSSTNTSALDVSSFNTSNVTDMSGMFEFNKNSILDLSSFDTSKVTDMSDMFRFSEAITGYAKNVADANMFNSSSNKPSGLIFGLK